MTISIARDSPRGSVGGRARDADYYPCLAVALGRQLYRDGLAAIMPLRPSKMPARVNGTWHRAHTAISKGHYLAYGPGGLI